MLHLVEFLQPRITKHGFTNIKFSVKIVFTSEYIFFIYLFILLLLVF